MKTQTRQLANRIQCLTGWSLIKINMVVQEYMAATGEGRIETMEYLLELLKNGEFNGEV